MRFLFLTLSYNTMNFFRNIALELLNRGHEVRVISIKDVPQKLTADKWEFFENNWGAFSWDKIKKYNPDRIIIFNGKFKELHAASSILQTMYKTAFAEVAWFPQKDYLYIDEAIHHMGSISRGLLDSEYLNSIILTDTHKEILESLKKKYAPQKNAIEVIDANLPKNYILVPMQLDSDTSILYASDVFKSMLSLAGFVKKTAPSAPVVIKLHPKEHNKDALIGELHKLGLFNIIDNNLSEENITMNDLAYRAKLIVGINSTSIMEALLHHKPILQLGENIAYKTGIGCMLDLAHYMRKELPVQSCYEDVLQGKAEGYNPEIMDKTILHMEINQIDFRNPQPWSIDMLINKFGQSRRIGET